jgi:hypothetical protein
VILGFLRTGSEFLLLGLRKKNLLIGFAIQSHSHWIAHPKIDDVLEDEIVSSKYYLSTQYLTTLREHRSRHEAKGNGFGYQVLERDQIANAIVVGGMGRERNLVVDSRLSDFTPVTKIKGKVNREGIRRMTPVNGRASKDFQKILRYLPLILRHTNNLEIQLQFLRSKPRRYKSFVPLVGNES